MADDKIALEIFIEADKAQMSLGELEDGFEQLQAKLKATNRGTEEGRKEFKKLASQMAQTSKEIKNIELSFEGLDREQVASEIGSVAGAVGDLSASLIILSGDNETLEATAQNIEKAMMVSMGLKGAIEGLSSARKLYNNLLRQANDDEKEGIALTVLKTAKEKAAAAGTLILNGVNKLLNTTLKMNPIGLIVIAITAVVGAIVYFKDAIWGLIKTALEPFQLIIDMVIDALQAMGIMASDEANAQEAASLKIIEASKKRREELDKLIEAENKKNKEVIKGIDFELSMRRALGKETTEIERKKLKTIVENTRRELDLSHERRKAILAELQERIKLGNTTKEEGDKLMEQAEETLKVIERQKDELLKSSRDLLVFETETFKEQQDKISKTIEESQKKRRENREKEAKKDFEERKARQDIELVETKEFNEEMYVEEEKKTFNTLSFLQLVIDKEAEAHQKELDRIEAERQARLAANQERLESASQIIGAIGSLNSAALATDLKNAGNNEKLKEKLRKASFEREKKLNIAMALVNGAQAQMSILAQTPKADFGIATAISMAAAAVTTIAQIAAIKATSYQGGGSPVTSESQNVSPNGAGAGGNGAAITPVTNTSTILGNQQVFVTETDITNTQNNVSVIEESATF